MAGLGELLTEYLDARSHGMGSVNGRYQTGNFCLR
jgi:hypothetical protein